MPSDFQSYSEQLRPALETAFRERLAELMGDVPFASVSSFIDTLAAGKKIRGCLSCMICEAAGGALESAMPRAVAVELIQAATLIHDDFVDHDSLRRNRPAAWTIEGARRAVLIGDVIFAATIKSMNDLGREDGAAVSQAIAEVSLGALQEPLEPMALVRAIESAGFDARLYKKIIRLKTGMLFATACALGAIAAGTDDAFKKTSYEYGLRIGAAYQIADDLKEVRAILEKGNFHLEESVAMAPALLCFAADRISDVLVLLKDGSGNLCESSAGLLRAVAWSMERDIELSLQAAASQLDGIISTNGHGALALRAPWDIVRMFNES